jgi:hypothetical protein
MNSKRCLGTAAVAALALVFAACGKSSSPSSPTDPSSPVGGGATINGTVAGLTATGSTAGGVAKLDATGGVTVTVSGTTIAVSVGSNGKFVLTGVPAGTVQLVFTTASGSSTITLDGVKEGDAIVVKVTIKGVTATLDDEERNGAAMTELEGQIAAVNPEGTTRTLDINTTRVSVPTTAAIRHGSTTVDFTSLKVGNRVHVRGLTSGAVLEATEVNVQNTNQKVPVNLTGTIAGFTANPACPVVQFKVGSWTVDTASTTSFQKTPCANLANGMTVHVKGDVQESGTVLATWVQGK